MVRGLLLTGLLGCQATPVAMHVFDPCSPDDGAERTNRLRWLTDYDDASGHHAERPKLVSIGCGTYVVLWEQWDGAAEAYLGTYAMAIDHTGEVLLPARPITDWHLPRGDDSFALDNTAAWLTGTRRRAPCCCTA